MTGHATPEYLARYRFLRTRDLDESRAVMSDVWGEHRVTPTTRKPFATAINHSRIGQAGLTFVDCRAPLRIECAPHDASYTIGFHEEGACQHTADGQAAVSTPDFSVIWLPGQELRLDTGEVKILCLDLPRPSVEQGRDARGSASARSGRSAPPIDAATGIGSALRSLCR